jgi:hypothetical protein
MGRIQEIEASVASQSSSSQFGVRLLQQWQASYGINILAVKTYRYTELGYHTDGSLRRIRDLSGQH